MVANKALVEFVLAHELDHALEDQRFGLPGSDGVNDDRALTETALTEGSATSVMVDYAARNLDPLELLSSTEGIDTGTGDVPKAYVDQLTWAYIGGLRFITALRALAGSWKLVDYALASRPPATTEQILHPRKYVTTSSRRRSASTGPRCATVAGSAPTAACSASCRRPSCSSSGSSTRPRAAAAGWDGDRYELWRRDVAPGDCEYPCRADLVLVAKWRFDTTRGANQFDRAVPGYLEGGLRATPAGQRVWRVDGGYVALAGRDRDAALAFAPERGLAVRTAVPQVPGPT